MESNRLFSNRKSPLLIVGVLLLSLATFLLMRAGNAAVDKVTTENAGSGREAAQRELVTIRLASKWKLKRASWGPVEVPEKPLPLEDEEPDPRAKAYQGLDVGVTGR